MGVVYAWGIVSFQLNASISVGFCTVKYATPVSYHIPSDSISVNDHTIYHCCVTSTSSRL